MAPEAQCTPHLHSLRSMCHAKLKTVLEAATQAGSRLPLSGIRLCGMCVSTCSVLVQVCCNLATMTHPLFDKQPVPYALSPKVSNPRSMEAALEAAFEMLSKVRTSCACLYTSIACFADCCNPMHHCPDCLTHERLTCLVWVCS